MESTNRQQAAEDYKSLKSFVTSLRSVGVEFPVIDFDSRIADLTRSADRDAEGALAAAEAARQSGGCREAIPFYRRSLDLVADHGGARTRISARHMSFEITA